VRSLPEKSGKPRSKGQILQQAKFALVSRFLKPMKELVAFSFDDPDINMTGYNRAQSYILKNAVCGVYPNYRIHYPSYSSAAAFCPMRYNLRQLLATMGAWSLPGPTTAAWVKPGPDDIPFCLCIAKRSTFAIIA